MGHANDYTTGTLGHLLTNYLEPMLRTTLIIYEKDSDNAPPVLMYEGYCADRQVPAYLRVGQVKEMYDAEGGGVVVTVVKVAQ
ncbi:hypothetical protein [Paenibacillus sinopodophylli]|uniref:hypothetical protein n=1 Tax=Paenibacillus sinopodophylli TaxID=1837342 RepID=UPI00110CF71F|nr:hypothetical protein [Paenibacillus sinopodophylli]